MWVLTRQSSRPSGGRSRLYRQPLRGRSAFIVKLWWLVRRTPGEVDVEARHTLDDSFGDERVGVRAHLPCPGLSARACRLNEKDAHHDVSLWRPGVSLGIGLRCLCSPTMFFHMGSQPPCMLHLMENRKKGETAPLDNPGACWLSSRGRVRVRRV